MAEMIKQVEKNMERQNGQDQTKEYSPIAIGEVFDPEIELGKIHLMPKEKKPEYLRKFKEKLSYQKQGIAVVERKILEFIKKKPDTDPNELLEKVKEDVVKFGFTQEQIDVINSALSKYEKFRNGLKTVLAMGDNREIFKHVTGADPSGKIKVEDGVMAAMFYCQSPDDYLRIKIRSIHQPPISNEDMEAIPIDQRKKFQKEWANCFTIRDYISKDMIEIEYAVAVLNMSIVKNDMERLPSEKLVGRGITQAKKHELSHIKGMIDKSILHNFLEDVQHFYTNDKSANGMCFLERIGPTPDTKSDGFYLELKRYLKAERNRIGLNRLVKNELLSNLEASWPEMPDIKIIDYISKYNTKYYLSADSNQEAIFYIKKILNKIGCDNDQTEKNLNSIFVEEIKKILEKCFEAANLLKENGYIREEIVAILSREPLTKWKKTAERLLAGKKIEPPEDAKESFKKDRFGFLKIWRNRYDRSNS